MVKIIIKPRNQGKVHSMRSIRLIEPIEKECPTCKLFVKPTEHFIFCTKHFTREHPECNWSRVARSQHAKCKTIQRNIPEIIKRTQKSQSPSARILSRYGFKNA